MKIEVVLINDRTYNLTIDNYYTRDNYLYLEYNDIENHRYDFICIPLNNVLFYKIIQCM